MLSERFEHALRLMVILCRRAPEHHTIDELVQLAQLPPSEVISFLGSLAGGDLVTEGPRGWTSAKPSADITLYGVISLVAPIKRITTCPMGYAEHGINLCPLHRTLDNALGALEVAFQRTTIHHLLHQPQTSRPLCRFPNAAIEAAVLSKPISPR
jgi:Rrf2 family nitric oxide-sensitive transcriptional repressor